MSVRMPLKAISFAESLDIPIIYIRKDNRSTAYVGLRDRKARCSRLKWGFGDFVVVLAGRRELSTHE